MFVLSNYVLERVIIKSVYRTTKINIYYEGEI